MNLLDEVVLGIDELEALRLADLEGLYQERAARRMRVSRPTFSRIVEAARRKVAEALVRGRAIKIEGGHIIVADQRIFRCRACRHEWQEPHGAGRPAACSSCGSKEFRRHG